MSAAAESGVSSGSEPGGPTELSPLPAMLMSRSASRLHREPVTLAPPVNVQPAPVYGGAFIGSRFHPMREDRPISSSSVGACDSSWGDPRQPFSPRYALWNGGLICQTAVACPPGRP